MSNFDPTKINFSYSLIKHLQKSPDHAVRARMYPEPSTDEQLFNLAIECAIQEPERYNDEYRIYNPPLSDEEKAIDMACRIPDQFPKKYMLYLPEKPAKNVKATKAYKEVVAKNPDRIILLADEMNLIADAVKEFKKTGIVPLKEKKNIRATKNFEDEKHRLPPGRLLTDKDNELIQAICVEFWKNSTLQSMYEIGTPQYKLETEFGATNVKGIPDFYSPRFTLFNDLKVVGKDASDAAVQPLIFRNNWHVQQAGYRWLAAQNKISLSHSILTFIESGPPRNVGINLVELTDQQLSIGHEIWMRELEKWEVYVRNNEFPSYTQSIHEVETPKWIARQHYENQY